MLPAGLHISTGEGSGGRLPLQHRFLRRLIEVNLAVYVLDPIDRDEMMMTTGFRVVLGQDNAVVAFLVIDRSDMFCRPIQQLPFVPECLDF
jgi:hypothetical protein